MATKTLSPNNLVTIPKDEYKRLKKLDRYIGGFVDYLDFLSDIRQSRQEIAEGKMISQEDLFKQYE